MTCFIGIGTNLGDRHKNLETAAQALKALPSVSRLRASPVFETPALVLEGAPDAWRIPYLNAVLEMEWKGSAEDLLAALKKIERDIGRGDAPRWSPRVIDLDILLFGEDVIDTPSLRVPHAGLWDRAFVLGPLKHLSPSLRPSQRLQTLLQRAREIRDQTPLWMGILNLTPDSFSDGGDLASVADLEKRITESEAAGVQIFDLGAESTRPGARVLSPDEEWARLETALLLLKERYAHRIFRPLISVDTRYAATAARALDAGVDMINDVSGLADPAMLELLQGSTCEYVLMHSLSVPADKTIVLNETCDPVEDVHAWARRKLDHLVKNGVARERIVFDPGLGFGKTPMQSLALLRGIERFFDLGTRILVGHSRKSFMTLWHRPDAKDREPESVGLSLRLASQGVDILRVHDISTHARAWRAWQESIVTLQEHTL